jgi:hypothetical protein
MLDSELAFWGFVATFIGLAATAASGGWAAFQYWRNSEVQRAEHARTCAIMAANEMEAFEKDAAVQGVMSMIDYCEMPDSATGVDADGAQPSVARPSSFKRCAIMVTA